MALKDIECTDDGDLLISGGDFALAELSRGELQEVLFRVRTETFGYTIDLDLAAGLDQYIGRPNKESLGIQLEQQVRQCLTRDGLYDSGDLKIDAVPLSMHTIGMYLFITSRQGSGLLTLSFTINLISGDISLLTD
jgi:hypothetical protein